MTDRLRYFSEDHGIEGFVGGAALRLFLEELAPRLDATTTGHLLVHGINAYEAAYLSRELSVPQVVPMSLEYGTLDNLGLPGALESLRRVVLDCQGRRNGYASPDAERRCARLTRELYYPSAPSWRRRIMAQTRTVLEAALMRFDQLELD